MRSDAELEALAGSRDARMLFNYPTISARKHDRESKQREAAAAASGGGGSSSSGGTQPACRSVHAIRVRCRVAWRRRQGRGCSAGGCMAAASMQHSPRGGVWGVGGQSWVRQAALYVTR